MILILPLDTLINDTGAAAASDKGNVKSGDAAAADAAPAAAKPEGLPAKAADVAKAEADENGKKEDAKPPEKRKRQYHVDTNTLRAFCYFDRTGAMPRQSSAASRS